jgi:Ribonuclease toxin, BrnT, of type II toxin-antitoxin system
LTQTYDPGTIRACNSRFSAQYRRSRRSLLALEFVKSPIEAKAADNYAKHGVSFELAVKVFQDPFGIERLDDREDYGEDRFILIGTAEGALLAVVLHREERPYPDNLGATSDEA